MKTNIEDRIKANARLVALVERASELLRRKLERSEPIVTIDWTLGQENKPASSVHLTITDPTTSVEADFTLTELADERFMDRRLNWLWGDLLEERSRIQIDELLKMTSDGTDE